jgi:hypothetical protein
MTKSENRRIGRMIASAFIGILLASAAIVLLYWNESRAADEFSASNQGLHQVVEARPDTVLPANDGKLVHLVGQIRAAIPAQDLAFGVSGDGLLRLRRKVEMYQWKEETNSATQQSMDDSPPTQPTYSYHRVWSENAIGSGTFHHMSGHVNPVMPMHSATFDSAAATLGAYRVETEVLDQISDFSPLAVARPPTMPSYSLPFFFVRPYVAEGGALYRGHDLANPSIGDLRVTFEAVYSQVFSVVATQLGSTLAPYHVVNGYESPLVKPGALSAAALFVGGKRERHTNIWLLRGVGFVLMVIALALIGAPMATHFTLVPFFKGIADAGALLIAVNFAVSVTIATIAFAWAPHQPLIASVLLAAALVSPLLFSLLFWAGKPILQRMPKD